MQIATGWSTQKIAERAAREAMAGIVAAGDRHPDFVLCELTEDYDVEEVLALLTQTWPETPVHLATTCRGVLLRRGWTSSAGRVLGLWSVFDAQGAFGTGGVPLEDRPSAAAALATRQALDQAGRAGELPSLIWISTAPGCEEQVLAGIESEVGTNVPILGGSTADNDVLGRWSQGTKAGTMSNGVVVSVFFPSVEIGYSYHNGYLPQAQSGTATEAEGRLIRSIDGRPAAEVYNEWTQGLIGPTLSEGGNIFDKTTFWPLGRVRGWLNNIPLYVLAHPERAEPDGALRLFADVEQGETVVLMSGTRNGLIRRAGRVAESALDSLDVLPSQISGALVIFCAGSMVAIEEHIDEVAQSIHQVLGDVPYLGCFTFGEQGRLVGGGNHHGNLMISVVVFSDQEAVF